MPEPSSDQHGATYTNTSNREILLTAPGTQGQTTLGIPFLTAAYLLVNYDRQPPTFSLWAADPANASSEIVAVDASGYRCSAPAINTTAADAGRPKASATAPSAVQTTSLSPAGIAGAVVGTLAGVLALAAAGLFVWRRRQRRPRPPAPAHHVQRVQQHLLSSELRHGKSKKPVTYPYAPGPVAVRELDSVEQHEMPHWSPAELEGTFPVGSAQR